MEYIAHKIGRVLAVKTNDQLQIPLPWPLIDALAKLQEAEEEADRPSISVPKAPRQGAFSRYMTTP